LLNWKNKVFTYLTKSLTNRCTDVAIDNEAILVLTIVPKNNALVNSIRNKIYKRKKFEKNIFSK